MHTRLLYSWGSLGYSSNSNDDSSDSCCCLAHLHLHSQYSLLDGANRIEDVVKKASRLKMPALALTDHGNLFGAVQFHDAAVRTGIKPIIGCEVYVARDGRHTKSGRSDRSNHLVLFINIKSLYNP